MRRITLVSAALAAALIVPAGAATAGRDADDRPVRDAAIDRAHDIERLRLHCAARITDRATDKSTSGAAVVGCEWSAPTSTRAAGVRLWRLDPAVDDHRRVVFRTGDLEVTTFTDTKVRRGHVYAYAVQALSSSGRVVGQSEVVRVHVPGDTDVEVLRLQCRLGPAREAIGCRWSRPEHREAAVVTLWRSVDGGPREIVERFRPDGPNTYRDPVPAGASRVTYAVIATSSSDRIVARSRPETVRIPSRTDVSAEVARL